MLRHPSDKTAPCHAEIAVKPQPPTLAAGGRRLLLSLSILGLGCTAGCGESYSLVPVEGVLKIDGTPAANISLQFRPDVTQGGEGPTSFAITDSAGKFQLKTYDGQLGAARGFHRVVLADLEEERPAQGQRSQRPPRLGSEYFGQASPLSVEVTDGASPLVLEARSPQQ